ncbi:MAG: MarR family transcriptional regulator [Euryarchaeota archaeon]|nr:MarR family transcriptional regulator [Euryarchaeota archaeon]
MNGHFREFEDEYLETMYEFFEKQPTEPVRNGDLAKSLGVSPASATEMIQRLAGKGLVNYTPYKGASLTEKGMVHGQKMKRRHRLAEVFLETISFQGNAHATACRLEHAIDDDLEVALSLLLGQPVLDPSGRDIPLATSEISERINSSKTQLITLERLEVGMTGRLEAVFLDDDAREHLKNFDLVLGKDVSRTASGYTFEGRLHIDLSSELASKLLVRISDTSD